MKFSRRRFACGVILVTLIWTMACVTAACAEAPTGRIEVRGQAVRIVMPDTVTINVGVTAQQDTEQAAYNDANRVVSDVLAALKTLDVPDSQIKTSRLEVSPRYSTIGTRRIIGYTANVSLSVTLTDFDLINPVIDQAIACGANNVGGMRFSFSEEGLAYRQALADATMIAREKAEVMAAAAGAELGAVLLLRESNNSNYSSYASYANVRSAYEMDIQPVADSQVMGGEIQISATVELTYAVK
jgi:uncharacterized protein YggE